jgi:small-conductance mechanosensitive channel
MQLTDALKGLQPWFAWAPSWVFTLVLMALALVAALVAHAVAMRLLSRSVHGRHADFWRPLLMRSRPLARLALIIVALSAAVAAAPLTTGERGLAQHAFAIAFVVLIGWISLIAVDLGGTLFARRNRMDVEDNLLARKHLTQIRILQRAAAVMVVVLTIGLALMTIDQVRQWGVSLLAAGGAAGILVGLALQPLLSNLLAGIQIAATQPIRLEDQVKVEGEIGRIEEINATYVVMRLLDDRRLVLPLTQFLQKPFENWTRDTAAQTGAVVLYVAFATPIEPMRRKLSELLAASPLWDRRINKVQVSDAKETTMEIRCLMSAADPIRLAELRCQVREAMITFLRDEYPGALGGEGPKPGAPDAKPVPTFAQQASG